MTPAARVQAAIELLDLIIVATRDNGPAADTLIANWFKTRRFAGSKDRRAVRELVYRAIRAYGSPPETGRAAMLGLGDLNDLFDGSSHGPAPIAEGEARAGNTALPDWLASLVPSDEVPALMGRAPLDLRVNALMAKRDDVLTSLPDAAPLSGLPFGLRLPENTRIAEDLPVEVQDAGSQFIVQACAAKPGETVIDLCAGAGGKTLALAADMRGQGRLIATDTDRNRIQRLMPRAERAGAASIETRMLNPKREMEALADLVGAADCVLVDAPCSGTGTWRRNPELRWRMTPKRLDQLVALQTHVLEMGAQLVKPGGRLVYAVCSLIDREGSDQVAAFLAQNPDFSASLPDTGRVHGPGRMLTPFRDETDGFFFAVLARNS